MRSACFVLLLSAVAISAYRPTLNLHPLPPNYNVVLTDVKQTKEFQDIVSYMSSQLSPSDIDEMLVAIPQMLVGINESNSDEDNTVVEQRSVISVVEHIPWEKIVNMIQKMTKSDSKFQKVLNLVNDQKFRDLVKKTVNSKTLASFVKNLTQHGFSWTEFLHLVLHALCETATTIQHDKYSVGVCQILKNV